MGMLWKEENEGRLLEVQLSGKLAHEDYERLAPEVDRLVKEHGLIDVLFEMDDFHGWKPRALWDDIKMDLRHFGDMRRVAMVGDKKWEKRMTMFTRPFTRAAVRYYDHSQIDEARNWLQSK